jgi:hypothetical protein
MHSFNQPRRTRRRIWLTWRLMVPIVAVATLVGLAEPVRAG